MKKNEAIEILNLENNNLTLENIKKHYKIQALKYHPDKSKENSNDDFCKIKEAYDVLLNHINNNNYIKNIIFNTFDKININDDNIKNNMYNFISNRINTLYENNIQSILKHIDNDQLIKIRDFLNKNNEVLHVPDEILKSLFEATNYYNNIYKTINLKPKLDDIFENNVYKLIYENNTYIIPLWHHELYYDEICVKIIPELPENIKIDENNNIIIYKKINIRELLNKENIDIYLGNKHIKLEVNKIKIKQHQSIILYKQGISRIDHSNIYNISNVSNIIIKLNLI